VVEIVNQIKVLVFLNGTIVVSEIGEVPSELGEPDCKLIKPFQLKTSTNSDVYLESWNSDYSSQDVFMVHSDKILTIMDPKPTILEKYQKLIK
jgi:hypothetical protein